MSYGPYLWACHSLLWILFAIQFWRMGLKCTGWASAKLEFELKSRTEMTPATKSLLHGRGPTSHANLAPMCNVKPRESILYFELSTMTQSAHISDVVFDSLVLIYETVQFWILRQFSLQFSCDFWSKQFSIFFLLFGRKRLGRKRRDI